MQHTRLPCISSSPGQSRRTSTTPMFPVSINLQWGPPDRNQTRRSCYFASRSVAVFKDRGVLLAYFDPPQTPRPIHPCPTPWPTDVMHCPQQEAFLQRRGRMPPAAKAIRIERRIEPQKTPLPAPSGHTPATVADATSAMHHKEANQAATPGFDPLAKVLGAITERHTEPPSVPLPPMAPSAGSVPAFPAAVHRSKSKVKHCEKGDAFDTLRESRCICFETDCTSTSKMLHEHATIISVFTHLSESTLQKSSHICS